MDYYWYRPGTVGTVFGFPAGRLYIEPAGAGFVGIAPGGFMGLAYPLGAGEFGIPAGGNIADGAVAGGGIVVEVARRAIETLLFDWTLFSGGF